MILESPSEDVEQPASQERSESTSAIDKVISTESSDGISGGDSNSPSEDTSISSPPVPDLNASSEALDAIPPEGKADDLLEKAGTVSRPGALVCQSGHWCGLVRACTLAADLNVGRSVCLFGCLFDGFWWP